MATIASALLVPARRRRSEIEIIDVDALDDNVHFAGRSVRPRLSPTPVAGPSEAGPSRDNPIVILDSDEEVEGAVVGHQALGEDSFPVICRRTALTPRLVRRRHRTMRSPPPPPFHLAHHIHFVPPVPPLPADFAHHHPPAIQPIAHPLPFEAQIIRAQQRNDTPRIPSPRPAPPSHHRPIMGLGGALISHNRQHQHEERRRRNNADARRETPAPVRFDWFSALLGSIENEHAPEDRGIKPEGKETTYKLSYTHPAPPLPGFTHNFDASDQEEARGSSATRAIFVSDDDDAAISPEVSPMLVCARCLDSLVLPGPSEEEEDDQRRIWALRCGHLLDGKCIKALMRPPAPPTQGIVAAADDATHPLPSGDSALAPSSSKGKSRAEPSSRTARKGKGKARALEESDVSMASMASVASVISISPPTLTTSPDGIDENPIRSRLRSRRQPDRAPSGYSPYTIPRAATSASVDEPTTFRPLGRKRSAAQASSLRAGRSKGKGRARKPQLLESHEFACPVESCGHVHQSILMTGEDWKMHPAKGAVAIFV